MHPGGARRNVRPDTITTGLKPSGALACASCTILRTHGENARPTHRRADAGITQRCDCHAYESAAIGLDGDQRGYATARSLTAGLATFGTNCAATRR